MNLKRLFPLFLLLVVASANGVFLENTNTPSLTLKRALLGGFSGFVALSNWFEIEGKFQDWNELMLYAKIQSATELDPQNLFYWVNGTAILAHDHPAQNPTIDRLQSSLRAKGLLDRGLNHLPDHPVLLYEYGKLYLLKFEDVKTARSYFKQASAK